MSMSVERPLRWWELPPETPVDVVYRAFMDDELERWHHEQSMRMVVERKFAPAPAALEDVDEC